MKPEYGYAERDEEEEFDEDEEEAEEEDDGMIDRQKGRRLIKGFSTVSARLDAPLLSPCPFFRISVAAPSHCVQHCGWHTFDDRGRFMSTPSVP